MRNTFLLTAIMLVAFSFPSHKYSSATSTAPTSSLNFIAAPPVAPGHTNKVASKAPTSFSSVYSNLTNCPSGLTKKEEKEAEDHGTDIPSRCKGFGGYAIDISYAACASIIAVAKGETHIPLAMQALNYKQKTVEWRLANGKPFAVIMRIYEYGGNDLCTTDGKTVGESLIVKGLKGYEHIDGEVKVKGTAEPNVKAREMADKGYR